MDPNFQKCTFIAFLSIELCACSLIFVAFLVIDVSPIINIYITANRVRVAHAVLLLLKMWLLVKKAGWNRAATRCGTGRGWSKKTVSLEDGPS